MLVCRQTLEILETTSRLIWMKDAMECSDRNQKSVKGAGADFLLGASCLKLYKLIIVNILQNKN